eukprot:2927142-Rhodomonas_salina.1
MRSSWTVPYPPTRPLGHVRYGHSVSCSAYHAIPALALGDTRYKLTARYNMTAKVLMSRRMVLPEDGDGVIALTEDHSGNLDRNEVRTMISGSSPPTFFLRARYDMSDTDVGRAAAAAVRRRSRKEEGGEEREGKERGRGGKREGGERRMRRRRRRKERGGSETAETRWVRARARTWWHGQCAATFRNQMQDGAFPVQT